MGRRKKVNKHIVSDIIIHQDREERALRKKERGRR
jgi:hypothetical protein